MGPFVESDLSVCPLVEAVEADEDSIPTDPLEQAAAASHRIHRGTGIVVAVLGLVGLVMGTKIATPIRNEVTGSSGIVSLSAKETASDPEPCSADGASCLKSGCCVPGGGNGLQCFKKSDDYAACAPSCEPGVHEPEKEGHWDETGTFVKAEWSCEKLGKPSKPGCHAFDNKTKSECPTEYCMSKGKSCMPKCDTYGGPDACWQGKDCMWADDTCMDACWAFDSHSTCKPGNKCYWTGEKCQMGWWLFNDHDSCPWDLGYMWNGSCSLDPCSMKDEDCSKSECCSKERGASGMTCYKKDKNWATCRETCEKDDEWSCEALGSRANYSAGCAWAGEDCGVDKLCCNRGFVCAVKDELFTGCVLTQKTSTWVAQEVPIPSDWEGTVVGAGRDEYEMQPAAEDEPKMGHTLYCFMAYLPGSYEDGLVALAKKNKASIYGCDAHDLFHTWESDSAGWDTGESTLQNTDVFINVWQQLGAKGTYSKYDWTVKVDPDCVMAADRLRSHIDSYNLAAWAAVYIKNNGQDPGLGNNGFLGAIEIFSKKAIQIYLDNDMGCKKALGLEAGEDGFMKGCMDGLGIGYVMDVDIFFPDNGAGACMNEARVAFHPLKEEHKWQHCWDILLGNSEF